MPLRRELGDSVTFSAAWVGSLDEEGKPTIDEGDPEAQSATVEICAGMVASAQQWLLFMECLYADDTWQALPLGWQNCAAANGIDDKAVSACIADGTGEEQLKASIAAAAAEGIQGVPTVFINGRHYLGDREEASLKARICYAGTDETLPAKCADVPRPQKISALLLTDERCADLEECRIDRELAFLAALLPSMEVRTVDYRSEEGQALYARIVEGKGLATVPVLVMKDGLDSFEDAKRALAEVMIPFEKGSLLPLGAGFDPTSEICDNGVDDNADGATDCADATCAQTPDCREEIKTRIDLFVMSQCPFGAMVMPAADHFLAHMRRDRSKVDFRIQFIGAEKDGAFDSMHGSAEVAEDIRTLCVQELYGENYAFMAYILCRARSYQSDEWEGCVTKKMDAKKISACADGALGKELLSASFKLAEETGMASSPSWMLNNRYVMDARSASQIFEQFCARNPSEDCNRPIKPLLIDSEGDQPPASCH